MRIKTCIVINLLNFRCTIYNIYLFSFFSTSLHLAVLVHNNDILTLLLEYAELGKIDLNAQTIDDHTPLYYALINTLKLDDDESFANRLVSAGANPNPVSYEHVKIKKCSFHFRQIVKLHNL